MPVVVVSAAAGAIIAKLAVVDSDHQEMIFEEHAL